MSLRKGGFKVYGAVAGMKIILKHKDGKDVKVLNETGFKLKDFSTL